MKLYPIITIFLFCFAGLASPQKDLCKGIRTNDPSLIQKALSEGASPKGPCGNQSALQLADELKHRELLESSSEENEWVLLEGNIPPFKEKLPVYLIKQSTFQAGWTAYEKAFLKVPKLPKVSFLTSSGEVYKLQDKLMRISDEISQLQSRYLATTPIDWPAQHTYINLTRLKEKIDILREIHFSIDNAIECYTELRKLELTEHEDILPSASASTDSEYLRQLKQLRMDLNPDIAVMNRFFRFGLLHLDNITSLKETIAKEGVSDELRPYIWQMLLGNMSTKQSRFESIDKARLAYSQMLEDRFPKGLDNFSFIDEEKHAELDAIVKDLPRTHGFFESASLRTSLKRVLFLFAAEHEYVQGLNYIPRELMLIFAKAYFGATIENEKISVKSLSGGDLTSLEADVFWCMKRMMQPVLEAGKGHEVFFFRTVELVEEELPRLLPKVYEKLQQTGAMLLPFITDSSVPFFASLLPSDALMHLWDSYLLEETPNGFAHLQHWVVLAILKKHEAEILKFNSGSKLQQFLGALPLSSYTIADIQGIIKQAKGFRQTD